MQQRPSEVFVRGLVEELQNLKHQLQEGQQENVQQKQALENMQQQLQQLQQRQEREQHLAISKDRVITELSERNHVM
jgi:phage shock protein A